MERRHFIALSLLLLMIPLSKNSTANSWEVIKSTLEHLFPKNKNFVGASELNLFQFIKLTSSDKTFKKEDLQSLIVGAKALLDFNNKFIYLDTTEKEQVLRQFEQKESSQSWLSLLMNYGCEGMFCDPIYSGNTNQLGWKAIHHNIGLPRPKGRYGI